MHRRILATLGGLALVLSACSSSGASSPPAAPAASAAGAACAPATGTGSVAVSVKDFAFDPATITAKVGDTVTFTNAGAAPHTATLDAGGCTTPTIKPGTSSGLTFSAAGSYTFHCTIHPAMKGTITVGA